MRKFLLLSMGITLIILISSCAKDKSLPDGYNKIFGNNEGVVADTVIIQAEGTERSFSKVVDTESSTELLFGTGPYRSGIYFKFEDLPDTAAIHSAELILNVKERIADGADTSFWNVSHQAYANAYFADIAINEINPPHKDNDLLINTFTVYSDSLGEITINLDSVQVNRWLTKGSAIQDYGIWLESFKSNFMAIYHSRESTEYTLLPQMKLIYTITDTAGSTRDTTYYYPKEDAFVLLNTVEDLNLNPDYLYIGKGIVFRGFLKFDLGLFDTTTHINRAVLELTTDPEHSHPNSIMICSQKSGCTIQSPLNRNFSANFVSYK